MRRGVFLLALVVVGCSQKPAPWFTPSEVVAPGIELYQSSDTTLVDPPGPIAVSMVKLDPLKVRLDSVLSKDDVMGVERVDQMAARRGALVAINGGGLSKIAWTFVVSDTVGAVQHLYPAVAGLVVVNAVVLFVWRRRHLAHVVPSAHAGSSG